MDVTVCDLQHRGKRCVALKFSYDFALKEYVKAFLGVKWSQTHQCFYLPYTEGVLERFGEYLKEGGYGFKNGLQVSSSTKGLPPLTHFQQELLQQYLDYLLGKRLSANTLKTYGHFVGEFLQFTRTKAPASLTEDDVRLYVEWAVKRKGYSISTHRQLIGALKHFAFFYPACAIDPAVLERPKKGRKLPVVLSMEEVMRLLQLTKNLKHRTLLAVIYSAGLRVGEALGLRAEDFDFERKLLRVVQAKGRKDRYVPLAAHLLPLLRTYHAAYRPQGYFFEGTHGQMYHTSSVRKILKKSCKLAGVTKRVTPHTLRHSYATHLLENGADIRYIQVLLGHAKPETTMVYTHVRSQELDAIGSPLDLLVERFSLSANAHGKVSLSPFYGRDNEHKS